MPKWTHSISNVTQCARPGTTQSDRGLRHPHLPHSGKLFFDGSLARTVQLRELEAAERRQAPANTSAMVIKRTLDVDSMRRLEKYDLHSQGLWVRPASPLATGMLLPELSSGVDVVQPRVRTSNITALSFSVSVSCTPVPLLCTRTEVGVGSTSVSLSA
jgi:hypothetical protein